MSLSENPESEFSPIPHGGEPSLRLLFLSVTGFPLSYPTRAGQWGINHCAQVQGGFSCHASRLLLCPFDPATLPSIANQNQKSKISQLASHDSRTYNCSFSKIDK